MRASIAIAILLAFAGCGQRTEKLTQLPAAEAKPAKDVTVSTLAVSTREVRHTVVATGTTEAKRAADLGPQMTARVNAVLVEEGDHAKAGQVLVKLDMVDAEMRVRQAEASAASAKANYQLSVAEYDRMAPLANNGPVTAQQLQRLASQRDALKAAADAAQIAAEDAKHDTTFAVVRAPFEGLVSRVSVEVGEVATMAPPKVLVRLVDLSSVDVRVKVHERELARIAVGDKVAAAFPSTGETAEGEVTFISPEIDPRTRNAEVLTRIPNPQGRLRAGMFAEIAVQPKLANQGIVVPLTAIGGTGDERFVYAVVNGTLVKRKVRVTPVGSEEVEVLEGLNPGDVIVRNEVARLSEGLHVKGTPASPAVAEP